MHNILFEDHTFSRLRPLALSTPTYEIRCGMFNTRERLELVDPGNNGLVLCREILRPLHTTPDWSWTSAALPDRSLWLNGRLAPNMELVAKLEGLRTSDWVFSDENGLLAASLPTNTGTMLLNSWQAWEQTAWSGDTWQIPRDIAGLPAPELGSHGPNLFSWFAARVTGSYTPFAGQTPKGPPTPAAVPFSGFT